MTENKFILFKRSLRRHFRNGEYSRCLVLMIKHFEDEDDPTSEEVDTLMSQFNTLERHFAELKAEQSELALTDIYRIEKWKNENDKLWTERNRIASSLRKILTEIKPIAFSDFKQRRYAPAHNRNRPHPRHLPNRR